MIKYLKETFDKNEHLDVGDLVRRYTNDVIASAAFGLQVDSLKDRDNEFYTLGQHLLFKFGVWQRISSFIVGVFPSLAKKLNLKIFPGKRSQFFHDLVTNTVSFRKQKKLHRPDMIQLLMEASKGTLHHSNVDEKDNVGFATVDEFLKPRGNANKTGFETGASVLALGIHELALNPDVQEKLYQEIRCFKETKGDLTYENMTDLKYFDCVLNETLRKWTAGLFMDRVCTKAYELPPPHEGEKPYPLKPGDIVYNVVYPVHMDTEYYPDPKKFNPDRFSDENEHKIRPFTFMPFGMGPRNCIGSRFAIIEMKVFLYNLVLNFKILKGEKTTDPIEMAPSDFNVRALGGTFVKLEPRD